jgi:hypothetical protein
MKSSDTSISRRRTLGGLAALAFAPAVAHAQSWPARTVKITVAYPPGGVADGTARLLADRLATVLGRSVVVDNKAGASGTIGMDAVAKAAPDGYALGFSSISALVLSPHLGKLPYDPVKDIVPVASVIASPVLLLGTSACTAKDFKALLTQAKTQPGALRWATSGPASLGHIVLEQVKAGAGVDITHVPYKGGGQQINDALAGAPGRAEGHAHAGRAGASGGQPGLGVRPVRAGGHAGRHRRSAECRGEQAAQGPRGAPAHRGGRERAHGRQRGRVRAPHRRRIGQQRAHRQAGGDHGREVTAGMRIASALRMGCS